MLTRETLPVRGRAVRIAGRAMVVVAGTAAVVAAVDREAAPVSYAIEVPIAIEVTRPIVHQAPAPMPEPVPAPESPAAAPERCPETVGLPDRPIGSALDAADEHYLGLTGIAASPSRADTFAAWSESEIYLTRDDGRSFDGILAPPGAVRSVRLDCHGAVFALAEPNWLGHRAPDGRETWRELSFMGSAEHAALAVGGGRVAVAHIVYNDHTTVALSDDAGVTWRFHRLADPTMEYLRHLAIDERAVVTLAVSLGDCMWDGLAIYTIDAAAGTVAATGDMTLDGVLAIGHDHWAYVTDDCDQAVCAIAPGRETIRRVRNAPAAVEPYAVAGAHHSYLLGGDGAVHRLNAGRAARVGDGAPAAVAFHTVDAGGRLLGLTEAGAVVRWSRRHGARVLSPAPR